MEMLVRYIVIAHVCNNGSIEYFNVCDNVSFKTATIEGSDAPDWLKERVALLRMCDVKRHDKKGEGIGRRFTSNMIYVYLTYDEYKELTKQTQECKHEYT